MVCQQCEQQGVQGGVYCSGCGQAFAGHAFEAQTHLFRPREGRKVAGVCAGFALRYDVDPILVRLALCAVVLCGFGWPVLAYLAAWIVMPNGPRAFYAAPPSSPTQVTA